MVFTEKARLNDVDGKSLMWTSAGKRGEGCGAGAFRGDLSVDVHELADTGESRVSRHVHGDRLDRTGRTAEADLTVAARGQQRRACGDQGGLAQEFPA